MATLEEIIKEANKRMAESDKREKSARQLISKDLHESLPVSARIAACEEAAKPYIQEYEKYNNFLLTLVNLMMDIDGRAK